MTRSDLEALPASESPQLVLVGRSAARRALFALSATAGLAAVHALLGKVHQLWKVPLPSVWRFEILSLNESLMLLIGLLTLVVVHKQFVLAMRPYLIVESGLSHESEMAINAAKKFWNVKLRNVGPGLAILKE